MFNRPLFEKTASFVCPFKSGQPGTKGDNLLDAWTVQKAWE